MLIELYQPRAMITALGSLFLSPDHCLVKKLFVTLKFHITAPCHFPRALSLSKREELSAAPQLLCSEHTKGPQLLSYILSSTPFPIFVSLLWCLIALCPYTMASIAAHIAQDETTQQRARQENPSPLWLAVLARCTPGYIWTFWLPGHIADSDPTCHHSKILDPFP